MGNSLSVNVNVITCRVHSTVRIIQHAIATVTAGVRRLQNQFPVWEKIKTERLAETMALTTLISFRHTDTVIF